MTDQYLLFPGVGEPSTSSQDSAVVVSQLANRSDRLFQVLNSIPDVIDSDDESDKDESTLLVALHSSAVHSSISKASVSELTDSLNNLDQLSFSMERLIVEKLDQLDAREIEINEELQEIRKLIDVDKLSYNRNSMNCFGMPYFKTADLRPFPPNQDYLDKVKNDELVSHDLPSSNFWTTNEITIIQNAVKSEVIDRELEKLNLQLNSTISDPDERRKEYRKAFTSLNKKPVGELLTDENHDFDWHKIAKYNFRDRHSPDECKRMWHLYTKPSVVKSHWSKEEDGKLKEIAKIKNFQDWESIAKELNTGRSGYQCFVQYKRRLAPLSRIGKWTPEEDKLLSKIIEQCRIGIYIPWSKVMYYFENRSLRQVFNRWNYSLNPTLKKGHFTRSEDFGLCVGVSLYGENFNKIASILGNRSASQIRERYRSKMNDSNSGSWTKEEDMKLIELYNKYGEKRWSQISTHLSRDRTQCRLRYSRLKNKYNFDLDSIRRTVQYKPLHAYEKAWFKQYFTSGKDEKTLRVVSKNLSLIKKRGRKGKSGTQIENQLIDFFLESYCDPDVHIFKNANIYDDVKLEEAAEVIKKLLKLFKANLCFPKNITENYIRSRDTNQVANDYMIKLITHVAKSYKAEEGTTSYNNFIVDASNDFAEIDTLDETDNAPEESINYDPSKFINWKISFELPFEKSYNRASMSSLIYGDTNEFYIDPLRLDPASPGPVDIPAESVGFNMAQSSSQLSFAKRNKNAPIMIPPKTKTQLDYLVPPSASSMVGLRTYMLARRKLWKMIGKNEVRDRSSQSKPPLMVTNRRKLSASEAYDLGISRFSSLLFWPLFLSAHSPSKFGHTKPTVSDDKLNSDQGSDSESAEDMFVKVLETKPKEKRKGEKKNTVHYRTKRKQERALARKKRSETQKSCDNSKSTITINHDPSKPKRKCDASASTSKSKHGPKLSAVVFPSKKHTTTKAICKNKGEMDSLTSTSLKSQELDSKETEKEEHENSDSKPVSYNVGTKRKKCDRPGGRRSERFKQPKVEKTEVDESHS